MKERGFSHQISYLFLILICSAIACGSFSDKPVVISTPLEGSVNETQQPSITSELGTSRFNPAPYGAEILSDQMVFSIVEVIRPTDQLVRDGEMFNPTPEEGKEYFFVKIRISCQREADQKCFFTLFDFKLVDSNGNVEDNESFVMGIDNLLEGSELFGGASEEGYLVFFVDKAESNPILMYEPFLGKSIYLNAYN